MLKNISFVLSGSQPDRMVRELFSSGLVRDLPPASIRMDHTDQPVTTDWKETYLPLTQRQLRFVWDDDEQEVQYYPAKRVLVSVKEITLDTLLNKLPAISFDLASFDTLFPEWEDLDPDYIAPSFANGHYPHGWACAFKGAGHKRMVSRRWLEYGPWKTMHLQNDTTFIGFHDLKANAAQALEQAKPGHQLMGISDEGGFIQDEYLFEFPIKGSYQPGEKLLKVIVHGAELRPKQLLDHSAAIQNQVLGEEKPLERIGFVFMEEEKARQYLHTLWLRGLECYTISGGREVRLDEDYHPPVEKPKWAMSPDRSP